MLAERARPFPVARPDELVESSLPFVAQAAKEFRDLGVPFDDLVSEGSLGLLEAARRYDSRRGTRFLTYARWWIRKAILRALEEQGRVVRLPEYQLRRAREARDVERALARSLGRRPTRDEVAEWLGRRPGARTRHESLPHREVSLDSPVTEGTNGTFAERFADTDSPGVEERLILDQSLRMMLDALDDLSEQQRGVLSRRFGLSGEPALSLKAIGGLLDLSHERVRQIEAAALDRLRRRLDGAPRGRFKRNGSRAPESGGPRS